MSQQQTANPDFLFLRDGTTYIRIPHTDVYYIEADGNYAYLQTAKQRFSIKKSLASIESELTAPQFVRCSRGIIVNFDRVQTINFSDGKISVGGKDLKLGKAYFSAIRARMPRI